MTAHATAAEAAAALGTFAALVVADPARYARAAAYAFEGGRCRVEGSPPEFVTAAGRVPVPYAQAEPPPPAGDGWRPG